jgi:hypothetical protein
MRTVSGRQKDRGIMFKNLQNKLENRKLWRFRRLEIGSLGHV